MSISNAYKQKIRANEDIASGKQKQVEGKIKETVGKVEDTLADVNIKIQEKLTNIKDHI